VSAPDVRVASQHLRRLTRAYAAGEMPIADYRRKRRAFVEACCAGRPVPREDVTVPRTARVRGEDDTLDAVPGGLGAPFATSRVGAPRGRRRWRWTMPVTVALLVMLVTGPAS